MIDVASQPPEFWRDFLKLKLDTQRGEISKPQRYYDGTHDAVLDSKRLGEKRLIDRYQRLRVNYCELLIDTFSDRLGVEGFRLGSDLEGDTAAWDIWQRNDLDEQAGLLHPEGLVSGRAAAIVWPDDDGLARITFELPSQVYVYCDPANREPVLALKNWCDDWGAEHSTLYTPDAIWRWTLNGGQQWAPREDAVGYYAENPFGVLCVVPFWNRRRLGGAPKSELTDVLGIQDAINESVAHIIVAQWFASFRQRWATGVEIPVDPETNQPIEVWKAALDRVWVAENPESKFGTFEATDISNLVSALGQHVGQFAAVSRLPLHYVAVSAAGIAGDALRAAEMGLVSRVRSLQRSFGAGHERVMRLAFLVEGDTARAKAHRAETIWTDPVMRSESERADALVKRASIGVPYRQLWLDAGYTETQCDQFDAWLSDAIKRGVMARLNLPAAAVQGQADNTAEGPAPA